MKVLIRYIQDRYNQSTDTIEVINDDITVDHLKRLIEERYQIDPSVQRLTVMLHDTCLVTMTNEWSLKFFGIRNHSLIYLETIDPLPLPNANSNSNLRNSYHSLLSSQADTKKKYLSSLHFHQKQLRQSMSIGESSNELNEDSDDKLEALLHIVKTGNLKQFNTFLKQYSSIVNSLNSLGLNGWNALHYASFHGFAALASELVHKHKCNPNTLNKEHWSPLHLASFKGHLETVKILLSLEGIDVNMNIEGLGTPLHCACRKNQSKVINVLLYKANRNIKDNQGKLPIDVTSDRNIKEMMLIIGKKYNAQDKENYFCHKAMLTTGEIEAFPFLLELDFIPPQPPKAAGFIEKIGNLLPMFRMRYVEIDPLLGAFSRYKAYEDYPFSPNEVIPLIDVALCGLDMESKPMFGDSEGYYFSLVYLKKEVYRVKSKEACLKWIDLINASCIYAKYWKHVSRKYSKASDYLYKQTPETIIIDHLTGKVSKVKPKPKPKPQSQSKPQLITDTKPNEIPQDQLIEDSSLKGITFDSFELLDQLGSGSFGKVYRVKLKSSPEASDNYFAMKILNKKMLISKHQLRYAITECNVLKQVSSPFIVTLHYAFQTQDNLYMILDYCPGGDLGIHIALRTFQEEEAKFYIAELLLAIEHLHDLNVIYRDLKPENILIAQDGHIKLADFGLAKENVKDNIKAKSFCGSPAYLTPEMINRKGVGKTADIYGIGAVLYEMLDGQPPYYARDMNVLYREITRGKLMLHEHYSPEVKDLLRQLLNKVPEKRIGIDDMKMHPFFAGIDWGKLKKGKVIPPKVLVKENKELMRDSSGSAEEEGEKDGNLKERFKKNQKMKGKEFKDNDYNESNKNVRRIKDFTFVKGKDCYKKDKIGGY